MWPISCARTPMISFGVSDCINAPTLTKMRRPSMTKALNCLFGTRYIVSPLPPMPATRRIGAMYSRSRDSISASRTKRMPPCAAAGCGTDQASTHTSARSAVTLRSRAERVERARAASSLHEDLADCIVSVPESREGRNPRSIGQTRLHHTCANRIASRLREPQGPIRRTPRPLRPLTESGIVVIGHDFVASVANLRASMQKKIPKGYE